MNELQIADFRSIFPKDIVKRNAGIGKPPESKFEIFIKLRSLLDSTSVNLAIKAMHLKDVVLIDAILRVGLDRLIVTTLYRMRPTLSEALAMILRWRKL